jgi:hypothetical protein
VGTAAIAPAVSHADKNNYGYQIDGGKRRWVNTCGNAQISYTNWTELSRQEFIQGETAYSGQDKEVAKKSRKRDRLGLLDQVVARIVESRTSGALHPRRRPP